LEIIEEEQKKRCWGNQVKMKKELVKRRNWRRKGKGW